MRWLLAAALLPVVWSFGFTVPEGKQECFEETAKASDHVSGEWRVAKGGVLDEVRVTSPAGDHVYSSEGDASGSFDYYATVEGVYRICFSNEKSTHLAKDVIAKITVGEPPDLIQLAKTEHLTPIEERIKNLHESMNALRDLQDQQRAQDDVQYRMSRSTRSWLLYFTLLEAIVLVAVRRVALPAAHLPLRPPAPLPSRRPALAEIGAPAAALADPVRAVCHRSLWQILYLRSFFEVKRVV